MIKFISVNNVILITVILKSLNTHDLILYCTYNILRFLNKNVLQVLQISIVS